MRGKATKEVKVKKGCCNFNKTKEAEDEDYIKELVKFNDSLFKDVKRAFQAVGNWRKLMITYVMR